MITALPFYDIESSYRGLYDSLSELRELFHTTGRFDDSNAKLDEIAKLLATYLAYKKGQIKKFPSGEGSPTSLLRELQRAFGLVARLPSYSDQGGTSIFGPAPTLHLRDDDGAITRKIVSLVRYSIDAAFANKSISQPFDVVNEAFGHFVRDNFRGNIEDAQYMTPPEVVDLMAALALDDLERDGVLASDEPLVVVDPSCGVGSFLAAFHHRYGGKHQRPLQIVGQDKVERMARLSKINLELFGSASGTVWIGNSLYRGSALDQLNCGADLILTNPPFGARFESSDIEKCAGNLSVFANPRMNARSLDSELLFVDRALSLLKDGGRLLIVVPDSVVSSSGMPGILRQYLRSNATLRAVIELPTVTFAQAGTRTRTVILYLQKGKNEKPRPVFFAQSSDLGFEVRARKGIQVKISTGESDLPKIRAAYARHVGEKRKDLFIVSDAPSAVAVEYKQILTGSWTPNHYNVSRVRAMKELSGRKQTKAVRLDEIVDFVSDSRSVRRYTKGSLFIGVLHVLSEGMLDIRGVKGYMPKTPGTPVEPGEILLSRINPRIPRAMVVPDLSSRLICSAEFEVMRAKAGIDPYLVVFLLYSDVVQHQIRSLTSGTSASHNRIKTRDLAQVMLPLPDSTSPRWRRVKAAVRKYCEAVSAIVAASSHLASLEAGRLDLLT